MISRWFSSMLQKVLDRVRPGAAVGETWPLPELLPQLAGRLVSLARAQLVLIGTRSSRLAFVEPGVSIAGRRHLRTGRGLVLERGVHLRAYGDGGLTIGSGVTIGRYSVVEVSSGLASRRGSIRLGDGVGISDYCFLGGAGGLAIGDRTVIGQHVSFHPENHGTEGSGDIKSRELSHQGIVVGSGCWIGAGVRVLDGAAIGDNSIIGAGSVVTKPIPANSIAYGVPARVVSTT